MRGCGIAALLVASATVVLVAQQQGLDPRDIAKPLSDSWPAYSGDYSGRRYSALKQTNQWHARIGNVSNAPQTYLVDGRQHVLVASGDRLYSFALY